MQKKDKKEKYIKVVGFSTPTGFQTSSRVVRPQENGMEQKRSWNDLMEETEGFNLYAQILCLLVGVLLIVGTGVMYKRLGGIDGLLNQEMCAKYGVTEYAVSLGCLVMFPILSIICFYLFLKKIIKRKSEIE